MKNLRPKPIIKPLMRSVNIFLSFTLWNIVSLDNVGMGGTMPEGICVRQTHPHVFYV